MAKILLVDDDLALLQVVSGLLSNLDKHAVDIASDAEQAQFLLNLNEYDLVILDWAMPGNTQGYEILDQYRKKGGKAPVLMLTGKVNVADKISCFNAGVDDYMTKPFHSQELVVRVRALLRRTPNLCHGTLKVSNVELNLTTLEVKQNGKVVELFQREFALLEFLLKHKNQYFKSQELLNRVWASDSEAGPDAVRQCISRLRAKLDTPEKPSIIQTVHGLGYRVRDLES